MHGDRDFLTNLPHDLGLDRQYQGGGATRDVIVRLLDDHAGQVAAQRGALFDSGFRYQKILRGILAFDEAGRYCTRHIAAADETDEIVAHDCSRWNSFSCPVGRRRQSLS